MKSERLEDVYKLAPMQLGMLFLAIIDRDSTSYFEQIEFKIKGEVDKNLLERSFNLLIERYDILRTIFHFEKSKDPVQIVLKSRSLEIKYEDISGLSEEKQELYIKRFKKQDRQEGFDLTKDLLLRISMFKMGKEYHTLLWSYHHILMDGWCMGIIFKDLLRIYISLKGGAGAELEPVTPYKNYIKWLEKQDREAGLKYWRQYLEGYEAKKILPGNGRLPRNNKYELKEYNFQVNETLTKELRRISGENQVTINTVFQVLWGILMLCYGNTDDIVFGAVTSGRPYEIEGIESMVGLFVNTIPLRIKIAGKMNFSRLLKKVQRETAFSKLYEYLPLADIQSKSSLNRDSLDHLLAFENYPVSVEVKDMCSSSKPGFVIESTDVYEQTNYDFVNYILFGSKKDLWVRFSYNSLVYDANTIERIASHFKEVIEQAAENPCFFVDEIVIMPQEQRRQLLFEFNQTRAENMFTGAIHRLFEKQAEKTPDNIAVSDTAITYKELNRKAGRLASILRKHGVTPGVVVGIMMEPSVEMLTALLAILKAGGAYLPIDIDLPEERVLFMLEDSDAGILLSDSRSVKKISFTTLRNFEAENEVQIIVTSPRAPLNEFNRLSHPDRSLINLKNYKNKIGMASVTNCISLQTTRGCPYECIYCHKIWSKKYFRRNAGNIYSEIEYYNKQGVTNFAVIDDCFNLNVDESRRLFELIIKNKLKVRIFFPNGLRGDIMTPGYIDLMVEAGTRGINLSLETASPRLQRLLKKNLDLKKFKEVVEYIAVEHPNVILEMATMHGFPTETEEEALLTLDFIKSIKWLHFPYIHILKIFPNSEMETFAVEQGVPKEDIMKSRDRAFHELPETLPFPKSFTRMYQANFMNDYFLNKERLKKVLPYQMAVLSETALAQKYNAYLPVEIKCVEDIIEFARLDEAGISGFDGAEGKVESIIFDREQQVKEDTNGSKKILFLDLSQHFSDYQMLYRVVEQPLGALYLLTYLKECFGDKISGRIYKSGVDFDNFGELKKLVDDYHPDMIGIRTLTFFKEFFHETVSMLRQWGYRGPVITGGPYASSDYKTILKDKNVDLVVFGEGEHTLRELIEEMFNNDFKLPGTDILHKIPGIAFTDRASSYNKSREIIMMDRLDSRITYEEPANTLTAVDANNLAYVMYTSGSSGIPKGVMVEHRQVNNCISWMQEKFNLDEGAVVVNRTNLTFDPSVWEIFWPLYTGAGVKILDTYQRKDAEFLIGLMAEDTRLTIMYCPATLVKMMVQLLDKKNVKPRLKLPWLIIGAEPITTDAVKNFYSYFAGEIVNTYGPTECTINNTFINLDRGKDYAVIPIGKPVTNNRIYILDCNLRPVPLDIPGEIYIAGESVSRGYINNPGRTNLAFIENPFGKGKLYKTGDIGLWRCDGTVEIKGRVDEQLKIHGYRIEPKEIENVLSAHPSISECVLAVKNSRDAEKEIKSCSVCGITTRYPNITVNKNGTCNICELFNRKELYLNNYFKTAAHLEQAITKANRDKRSKYDCLLLYAGGRGAAYALYRLVDMGFNVLAFTYDNGYFGKSDLNNIKKITTSLSVDHVIMKHKNSDRILGASIKMAATVCRGCFHTSSSLAAEYAYKNGIQVVVGATLSRGQIIENKLLMFLQQGMSTEREFEKEILNIQKSAPEIDKEIFDLIDIDIVKDGTVYEYVKFMDFYRCCDVTNRELIAFLEEKDPYWKNRKNYSVYSTNCPIKQISDFGHLHERGYHYYGAATSWEVRLRHFKLVGLEEDLKIRVSPKAYENFLKRIGKPSNSKPKKSDKYLCAYYVPSKNAKEDELSVSKLRGYLSHVLPGYMIPSYFVQLKEIPLTINGKINKKALPEPKLTRANLGSTYVSPKTDTEKKISEIWKEVLGVEMVGTKDNFFDLGGNSLSVITVSSKLKAVINRELPIVTLFSYPTIHSLINYLEQPENHGAVSETTVDRADELENGKKRLLQSMKRRQRTL